ncbi:hypothetical protein [Beggiatoa leptomitoformis]|uniref:Uncharacterized protein n=1 Tax=Beggiatoa leptomitoformis TaxID=288004 RepID=A0A2N9YDZ9_9GAMM|nr:hypothetical protein [Beggiatoa leptomitoformis]ALG68903.1 hypothetical protein AL038_15865 [Beggiatoa leptomitoformis]AUI68722.1 hypothetical protein BLE401_08395 [Beggiatoa leptomitoformis]
MTNLLLTTLVFTFFIIPNIEQPIDVPLWKAVVRANVITIGKVTGLSETDNSFTADFQIISTLKGSILKTDQEVTFYTEKHKSLFKNCLKQDCIVFLGKSPDSDEISLFNWSKAITDISKETAFTRMVKQEILQQVTDVKKVHDYLNQNPLNEELTVKQFLVDIFDKEKVYKAYDQLQTLDVSVAPALIKYMDDRRVLPYPGLGLNSPHVFEDGSVEDITHYSPDLVIDLLDTMLGEITGEGSELYNGGTEEIRKERVFFWHVWLCHKQPVFCE